VGIYTVTPVSSYVPVAANTNYSVYTVPASKVFVLRNVILNSGTSGAKGFIRRHNGTTSNNVCGILVATLNDARFVETRMAFSAGWAIELRADTANTLAFTLTGYLLDA